MVEIFGKNIFLHLHQAIRAFRCYPILVKCRNKPFYRKGFFSNSFKYPEALFSTIFVCFMIVNNS